MQQRETFETAAMAVAKVVDRRIRMALAARTTTSTSTMVTVNVAATEFLIVEVTAIENGLVDVKVIAREQAGG